MKTGRKAAPEILKEAAETFALRSKIYGSNYTRSGPLLMALFSEKGIPAIKTGEDASRLGLIVMCLTKLQRYAHCFEAGGHQDSARDLQVYAAMLEEFTK
jgi:hypothetical protein